MYGSKCAWFLKCVFVVSLLVSFLYIQLDGSNPSVDPSDEPDFYEQSMIPA